MAGNEGKRKIVVKVGTSTLTHEGGTLNLRSFDALARVLSDIRNMGHEVILVSSGAIAVGAGKMKMKEMPSKLSHKQAAAAVGQCELMHLYDKFFAEYNNIVAQILLTREDVDSQEKKQNLLNTFEALLEMGIIPIVNENDSVSHAEIESHTDEHKLFGDNDSLSAVVAVLCGADTLILLSDIDGLYDCNPAEDQNARLIREVRIIDEEIICCAGGAGSRRGTGGMITKIHAAELATQNGIDMIIANGERPELLYDILAGRQVGTLFTGRKGKNERA